jgi:carboxyl-terminal processing protease
LALFLFIAVWVSGFIHGTSWGWQTNLPSPFEKIINKEPPIEVPKSDMSIFWDTWKIVLEKYVSRQDLDPEKIILGATRGLVDSLEDPYSDFLTAEQTKELSEELSGEFFGVGMEIGRQDEYLVVISPLPSTPAEKAGLKPNDMILAINETDTMGLSTTQAANLIRGEAGTKVVLTIYRSTWNEAKKIELTREKITIPSASWEKIEDNIAYLKIYNFNRPLTFDFYQIALEISFAKPKGLIIDVRNNPGGYLDAVIDISGWFLSNGDIVLKEDFGNEEIKSFRVRLGQSLLKNIPTVVLINEGTASASEILAGALRDNREVKLIGTKTFGKGSVQELITLKDNNSIKLTISRWLTPKGTIIQDSGLEPDIEVENDEDFGTYSKIDLEKDKQLLTAIAELKK